MRPLIIDVSAAQAPSTIDRPAAKAAGVVGAIVRAEYGTKIDAQFHAWIEAFIRDGFHVGVYSFQMTDADPADEVAVLCKEIAPYTLDYGVSLDIETRNGQSPSNVVAWSSAFITGTEDVRAEPFGLVYTGPSFWRSLGDVAQAPEWAARNLWLANYGAQTPLLTPPWGRWQQPGGPALWQAYGNTIWQNRATRETRWGKAPPNGSQWFKIASAYPAPWSSGEVDVSLLPGLDDSPLLVNPCRSSA